MYLYGLLPLQTTPTILPLSDPLKLHRLAARHNTFPRTKQPLTQYQNFPNSALRYYHLHHPETTACSICHVTIRHTLLTHDPYPANNTPAALPVTLERFPYLPILTRTS